MFLPLFQFKFDKLAKRNFFFTGYTFQKFKTLTKRQRSCDQQSTK